MRKARLDVAQIGFFQPILESVTDYNSFHSRLLSQSGLQQFDLYNVDSYVPLTCMYQMFDVIARYIKKDNFIGVFGESISLAAMNSWGHMIAHTKDVLDACQTAVKYDSVVISNETMSFFIDGDRSYIMSEYLDAPHHRESGVMETVNLLLMLRGFQIALGQDWCPIEIHLEQSRGLDLDAILADDQKCKVYYNQAKTQVVFHTSDLAKPMLGGISEETKAAFMNHGESLTLRIENILDSYMYRNIPTLEKISDFAGVSSRTIQRNLKDEGHSFMEVLDRWRFKKAILLLEDPKMKVNDISHVLGYANSSNFIRCFLRWTQTTPSMYRECM